MEICIRWSRLARLLLTRDKNKSNKKVIKRWTKLLIRASKAGRVQLRSLWSFEDIIKGIDKLKEKDRKLNSLSIIGRWGYLSEMILKRDLNQKQVRAVANWKKIIKTIAIYNNYFSLKSFLSLDKKEILRVLGVKDNKLKRL